MTEIEHSEDYKHKLEYIQAMAQLEAQEKKINQSQGYGKAYLLSILIPPLGVYYFIKYVFLNGGEEENTKAGIISLVLTIVSLLLSFWMMALLFKQSTSALSPKDNEMLRDLTVPENQPVRLPGL